MIEHPSFNQEYYEAALAWVNRVALPYNLVEEVKGTFIRFLEARFETNDYPVSPEDYMQEVSNACYEWDI